MIAIKHAILRSMGFMLYKRNCGMGVQPLMSMTGTAEGLAAYNFT
jgi:hypothetical protein